MEHNKENVRSSELPSAHQFDDKVIVFLLPEMEENFPGIPARIKGIHFYSGGHVKYDVELSFHGDYVSRIHNVDSALVKQMP